ncbi:MAG: VWA domain-containing protein [Anaerolineae bacterium]|nr:VWA domain-containing protein [Anaerolineae bacterium]MDW8171394.1 VWA domain-containing protein [Anaerolineae bacterium]
MMNDFRLAFPLALSLFLPLLLGLLWQRRALSRAAPVLRYSDTRLLSGLSASARLRLRRLPDLMRLLAWAALVLALARPQSGQAEVRLSGQGVDIVLAIDISNSMATRDFDDLDRLSAAKRVSANFILGREFDRVGLVVFSEDALYQAPPTLDYRLLLESLAQVTFAEDLGLSNRTALGMGIGMGLNMLSSSQSNSRVIILVTDGANNTGRIDPITAAEMAAALGVRIYTIGVGTPASGDLDLLTLERIASISRGRSFNAAQLNDLSAVYAEIDRLEPSPVERLLYTQWQEQAHLPLLLALILLIAERFLRHTIFQSLP